MKAFSIMKNYCYRFLLLLIAIIFTGLTINVIFNNISYFGKINVFISIIGILLYLLFLFGIYIVINRNIKKITKKREIIILAIFFGIFILLQVICGLLLRVTPSWDYGIVYNNAVTFATTGSFGNLEYYSLFPNNLAVLFIFSMCFKLGALVHFTDFYFVGVVVNIISISSSILLLYLIVRKKMSKKLAFLALVISASVLAFFTYVPIFYTDTMSLPYIMAMIYLLECVEMDKLIGWKKIGYYILTGLVCFIGYMVKMTVIICFIGIFIYHVLCKKDIKRFVILILMLASLTVLFNKTVVKSVNDVTKIEPLPYTHWIMMGMNKETMGGYNENDYALITHSVSAASERKQLNIAEIKKRLKDFGVSGYAKFLIDKANITFGDGTYYAPEKLRRSVVKYTPLHDYFLVGTKNFNIYYTYSQVIHFTLMILMSISAFVLFKEKKFNFIFASLLSILGLLFFLLIWETRSRYLVNFIPLFILSAIVGFEALFDKFTKVFNKEKN